LVEIGFGCADIGYVRDCWYMVRRVDSAHHDDQGPDQHRPRARA